MRRSIVAVAAVVAVLSAGMLPHAGAAAAKLKKPTKIDGTKTSFVVKSSLYPVGGEPGYGRLSVTFPQPDPAEAISKFTLVCTPVAGAKSTASYPVDPTTDEFLVGVVANKYVSANANFTAAAGAFVSATSTGGTITLKSSKFPDSKSPSAKCRVDVTNATATVAGKTPKVTTAPGSDCDVLTQEDSPLDPATQLTNPATDDVMPTSGNFFLRVTIFVPALDKNFGTFCTTDRAAYPKWLTDQAVTFTGGTKVVYKPKTSTRTVTVKKLKLTAPLTSSITLNTVGSFIQYKYDQSKLTALGLGTGALANKCEVSAAKMAGKSNTCTFDNSTGIITVSGNDELVIKPGKPIIGPTITVTFNYAPGAGTADLQLITSKTRISIAGNPVDVTVDDTFDCVESADPDLGFGVDMTNAEITAAVGSGNVPNICYDGQGATDPNHGRPVIQWTGLV